MPTTLAVFLLVNAVWGFIVWPPFFRRVAKDPRAQSTNGRPTKFLIVHTVLVGVSLLLATVSLVLGILGLFV
ncbi:MAG: hypothetical protein JWR33_429 [Naasia sp.]|uniref:SCO4848 family membrane protein n=1 Tax=Naasia sp. TaxID=2546198 RepID=UPI0026062D42|nr:hypothetical protein [Naasia sp.]MCU1569688.1 hypothetical protein [Naasia sp.]